MIDRVVAIDIPLWTADIDGDGLLVAEIPAGKNVLQVALERAGRKIVRHNRALDGCLIMGYEVEVANQEGVDVLRFRLHVVGKGKPDAL